MVGHENGTVQSAPPLRTPIMLVHCNRWLLASAAIYLAVMSTNALNFWRSFSFTVGGACAVVIIVAGWRGKASRTPWPGTLLLFSFVAWCAWCVASLAWSTKPSYSAGQLRGEILWTIAVTLTIYVAARDVKAWRTLLIATLGSFALASAFAAVLLVSPWGWDPGRWHMGVGPWTTYLVLIAPLLLTLVIPPPAGLARDRRAHVAGMVLLVLLLATARVTDNRMVWIALATSVVLIGALGALRWRSNSATAPIRWLLPLACVLVVAIGVLFTDTAREKAETFFPPDTTIAQTLAEDPRLELWEHMADHIRERPWTGFGFGRAILAPELKSELHDPLLWHAHNMFASQWLQTGAVGLSLFLLMLLALASRYIRFFRSRDDALAVTGMIGLAMLAGFVMKNLTDDFMFHANAKHFFALNALLIGWGVRRERTSAAALPDSDQRLRGARSGSGAETVSEPAGGPAGIGCIGAPAGGEYSGIQECNRERTSASSAMRSRSHQAII